MLALPTRSPLLALPPPAQSESVLFLPSLLPPEPIATPESYSDRVRARAVALERTIHEALSHRSDIPTALADWKEEIAAEFRVIVATVAPGQDLPEHLAGYDGDGVFEALKTLWPVPPVNRLPQV